MADRIDALIQRSRLGDVGLTSQEKEELQNALLGLAPSSEKYKTIMSVLGKPRGPFYSNYRSPDQNADGTYRKVNEPTFQGPPTLDFLSHKPDGLDRPSAARGHDAAGSVTSTKMQPTEGVSIGGDPVDRWFNFEGGGGAVANNLLGQGPEGHNELSDAYNIDDILTEVPEGYSFSGIAPGQLGMIANDPAVLAQMLAEDMGGEAGTAAYLSPYIKMANDLSYQGVYGGNTVDDSVIGGPTSNLDRLVQIEDVVDFINQPGNQMFDAGELYGRSYDRVQNTDFNEYAGPNGEPYSHDDIIAMTNNALMATTPLLSPEGQAGLSAKLNAAGVQYKLKLATGEIGSISYPKFLETLNARSWMGE